MLIVLLVIGFFVTMVYTAYNTLYLHDFETTAPAASTP